jgi:hypothetical protein
MVLRAPLTEAMGARQSCWGGDGRRAGGLDVHTQLSDADAGAVPMLHSARKASAGCWLEGGGLEGSRSDSARGGGMWWSTRPACAVLRC